MGRSTTFAANVRNPSDSTTGTASRALSGNGHDRSALCARAVPPKYATLPPHDTTACSATARAVARPHVGTQLMQAVLNQPQPRRASVPLIAWVLPHHLPRHTNFRFSPRLHLEQLRAQLFLFDPDPTPSTTRVGATQRRGYSFPPPAPYRTVSPPAHTRPTHPDADLRPDAAGRIKDGASCARVARTPSSTPYPSSLLSSSWSAHHRLRSGLHKGST